MHVHKLTEALNLKLGTLADNARLAKGFLYQQMQLEASALAFNDAFYIQALLFLALLFSLLLLRQPRHGKRPSPPPGH
jgi:DHA2 family multidrug resistance protein